MEELVVDALVIGWGKGGKTLAGALGRRGRSVALVEKSTEMYGGGCINVACVPTKDLVHSAEHRRVGDDPQTWFSDSVAGRDALVEKLRKRNYDMLAGVDTVTLIEGHAHRSRHASCRSSPVRTSAPRPTASRCRARSSSRRRRPASA